MNNTRIWLHIVGAIAAAIAGGTVKFAGLSADATTNIVGIAALAGFAVNAWLAATSTGVSLPMKRGKP